MGATFDPPPWLAIRDDLYRRVLNRQAVTLTKSLRKCGRALQVKQAMDAIHAAYHRCDGLDPYDGSPLQGELLAELLPGVSRLLGADHQERWDRLPTVGQIPGEPGIEVEIVSRRTWMAKGERTAEAYLAHCRAVVAWMESENCAGRRQ